MYKPTMARLCSVRTAVGLFLSGLAFLGSVSPLAAQDSLAEQQIRGLEGLKEAKILLRPNDLNDTSTNQVMSDSLELALRRKVPELKLLKSDETDWVLLSWIILPGKAATLELSVLRWVRIEASNKQIFATVWNASGGLYSSNVPEKTLTEAVEGLVNRLALDYLRANPPQRSQ